MIAFMKSLWRDRRGNVLVITAAMLPLVVGSAGLASDTIQWSLWNRQLQRAADSAAIAGVYARFQNQAVGTAIATDLATNNHTVASLVAGFPTFSLPANTPTSINSVQVNLAAQKTLGFSSLFISAAPIIDASAIAAAVPDGDFCAIGLDPVGPAVTIGGSSNTELGCDAISNSIPPVGTPSVNINGSAYSFTADLFAGAGTMPSSITGVDEIESHHLAQPDPFAGKYSTTIPAGMNCRNMNQNEVNESPNNPAVTTLAPGCYNQFRFNSTGAQFVLLPGVYYLDNTDFVANGGTITGTGVTIVLTGTDPGSIQMNGNANLQLRAPTQSTPATATSPAVAGTCGTFNGVNSCDYAKMLFIQAANADEANNNTINGSSSSLFDGALYFPRGDVNLSGNSAATTRCVMVVGFRLTFTGNSALQNNTVGCDNDMTVPGWKIRLTA